MATGILTLLGTLAALVFWWVRRSAAKADDPKEQNRNRYETIDQDLAKRDDLAATVHADDDLAELERLQNARKGH